MATSIEPLILVVEDDPDHAALIQAVFQSGQVEAKTHLVVSGREARSYLAGEWPYNDRYRYPLPSLIVLDLGLPDHTGFEAGFEILAWLLVEREWVSRIPVIVFTASKKMGHARRAYALGARRFLNKPDDFGNLVEAVKEELDRWFEWKSGSGGAQPRPPPDVKWRAVGRGEGILDDPPGGPKREKVQDREVVTQSRLFKILNEELHQRTGSEDAKIVGNLWPLEREPSGRNWELDLKVRDEDDSDRLFKEQVRRVVREAYGRYNIEWWEPS